MTDNPFKAAIEEAVQTHVREQAEQSAAWDRAKLELVQACKDFNEALAPARLILRSRGDDSYQHIDQQAPDNRAKYMDALIEGGQERYWLGNVTWCNSSQTWDRRYSPSYNTFAEVLTAYARSTDFGRDVDLCQRAEQAQALHPDHQSDLDRAVAAAVARGELTPRDEVTHLPDTNMFIVQPEACAIRRRSRVIVSLAGVVIAAACLALCGCDTRQQDDRPRDEIVCLPAGWSFHSLGQRLTSEWSYDMPLLQRGSPAAPGVFRLMSHPRFSETLFVEHGADLELCPIDGAR